MRHIFWTALWSALLKQHLQCGGWQISLSLQQKGPFLASLMINYSRKAPAFPCFIAKWTILPLLQKNNSCISPLPYPVYFAVLLYICPVEFDFFFLSGLYPWHVISSKIFFPTIIWFAFLLFPLFIKQSLWFNQELCFLFLPISSHFWWHQPGLALTWWPKMSLFQF